MGKWNIKTNIKFDIITIDIKLKATIETVVQQ